MVLLHVARATSMESLPLVFRSIRRFCDVIQIPFVLIKLCLLWFFVQTLTETIINCDRCRRLSTLRHVCHVGGTKQRYTSMKRSCFAFDVLCFHDESPSRSGLAASSTTGGSIASAMTVTTLTLCSIRMMADLPDRNSVLE